MLLIGRRLDHEEKDKEVSVFGFEGTCIQLLRNARTHSLGNAKHHLALLHSQYNPGSNQPKVSELPTAS